MLSKVARPWRRGSIVGAAAGGGGGADPGRARGETPIAELHLGIAAAAARDLGGAAHAADSDLLSAVKRATQVLSTGRSSGRRIYLIGHTSRTRWTGRPCRPPRPKSLWSTSAMAGRAPNRAVVDLRAEPTASMGPRARAGDGGAGTTSATRP